MIKCCKRAELTSVRNTQEKKGKKSKLCSPLHSNVHCTLLCQMLLLVYCNKKSCLCLFTGKMLLSFLDADQLMISLLANCVFWGRHSPCCEFSNEPWLSHYRWFMALEVVLANLYFLIALQSWKHSFIWEIWESPATESFCTILDSLFWVMLNYVFYFQRVYTMAEWY